MFEVFAYQFNCTQTSRGMMLHQNDCQKVYLEDGSALTYLNSDKPNFLSACTRAYLP